MKLLPTIPQNTGNRLADIARWAIFKPEHNKPIKTIDNEIVYKRNPNLPTVNRPGSGVVHFPKALDPDRSFAYSKKIERTRKPTSIFYRVFFISAIVGTTGKHTPTGDGDGGRARAQADLPPSFSRPFDAPNRIPPQLSCTGSTLSGTGTIEYGERRYVPSPVGRVPPHRLAPISPARARPSGRCPALR